MIPILVRIFSGSKLQVKVVVPTAVSCSRLTNEQTLSDIGTREYGGFHFG